MNILMNISIFGEQWAESSIEIYKYIIIKDFKSLLL